MGLQLNPKKDSSETAGVMTGFEGISGQITLPADWAVGRSSVQFKGPVLPIIRTDSSVMEALKKDNQPTFNDRGWLEHAENRLHALSSLKANWDGYDAEPPSEQSIQRSREFLKLLNEQKLHPTKVHASAAGGIEIVVRLDKKYFAVEFLNSGTGLYELRFDGYENVAELPGTIAGKMTLIERVKREFGN